MTATDELRRENERLRQQVASIIGRSFRTADKMDCLERENAKLRELVRDLLHHIEYPPCEGCLLEMSCAGDLSQCDEYFDWLKPRARKLGVEVDG